MYLRDDDPIRGARWQAPSGQNSVLRPSVSAHQELICALRPIGCPRLSEPNFFGLGAMDR
jgi:hypothetical protein